MAHPDEVITLRSCAGVHNLTDSWNRCEFVVANEDCHRSDGFLSYLDVIYCMPHSPYLPLSLLAAWSLYLFGVLAITANDFLCPALVAISKKFGLSQAVAGVTFLAIGNGAPDIIASFTAINQNRSMLMISELFGAGTFVTSIVAGYVFYSSSFIVERFSFTRDVAFYMLAAAIAFSMFRSGEATVYHAVAFLVVYVVYILTVLVREFIGRDAGKSAAPATASPSVNAAFEFPGEGECLFSEQSHNRLRRPSGLNVHHQNAIRQLLQPPNGSPTSPAPMFRPRTPSTCSAATASVVPQSVISKDVVGQRKRSTSTGMAGYQSIAQIRSQLDRLSSVTDSSETEYADDHLSPWKEFWIHVAPTSWQELKEESKLSMPWRVLALPIQTILALTVPVVDYEHEKDNWCKALNVINCMTAPLAICLIVFKDQELYDLPVAVYAVVLGAMVASLVMATSTRDEAPWYHFVFALLAFVTGVCFIYAACRELMAVLKAVGVDRGIDDSVLGLTVLAWGSSVGDLITDSTVARQGYPAMAIAAAFAGPMLNLLIGLGSAFSVRLIRESAWSVPVECPSILLVLYAALSSSLMVSLVFLSCTGFRSSSTLSIMLAFVYVTFLATALTMTMHPNILPPS
ncbi:sodium/potassium/calcium exchanger 6-like [Tropilaelaps mercedesae]|uniref:Sodium/potassium/calcium exchanger 6-like n=1 Tax=Tropilaelaps mercedesae TaxID=418985 RepID=A0A1V9Y1B5_9ACAR|nr:sodium/potassium/calcium exchanger 6-like [Tropilaelaps mercedesae]